MALVVVCPGSRPDSYSDRAMCFSSASCDILKVIKVSKEFKFPIRSKHAEINFNHSSLIDAKFDEVSDITT